MRNKQKRKVYNFSQDVFAAIWKAIHVARQKYEENRTVVGGAVEHAEALVNRHKAEPELLSSLIQTGWIKHCPTSDHYYVQLA